VSRPVRIQRRRRLHSTRVTCTRAPTHAHAHAHAHATRTRNTHTQHAHATRTRTRTRTRTHTHTITHSPTHPLTHSRARGRATRLHGRAPVRSHAHAHARTHAGTHAHACARTVSTRSGVSTKACAGTICASKRTQTLGQLRTRVHPSHVCVHTQSWTRRCAYTRTNQCRVLSEGDCAPQSCGAPARRRTHHACRRVQSDRGPSHIGCMTAL
jgi:hypothetical protein